MDLSGVISGTSRTLAASGPAAVYAGAGAASLYGVAVTEPRHPDLVGVAQHGVVYTGGTKKIAEHGGMDPQDRNVPIVISGGRQDEDQRRRTVTAPVETTQIAPTILTLLGLKPSALHAVQLEGTKVLPGLCD